MTEPRVLADLLHRAADSTRGVRFLDSGENAQQVSYATLRQRAGALLGYFQQQGLGPGDKVLLFVRNNRAFIDAFWACQLGGLVPVPLSAGVQAASLDKLSQVAQRMDRAWLFSERSLYQRLKQDYGGERLFAQRVCLLEAIHEVPAGGEHHNADPGDTALIQFSSGSTSEPRGVQLTHANLLANIAAISRAAAIDAGDSTLSWMPLSHDMGLIGFHLVPLFNCLDQALMEPGLFIRRPALWLDYAASLGATLLCSPNFGYQHYLKNVPESVGAPDLGRVRLLFNGAEPVSAQVCRDFQQRLSAHGLRENAWFPVYGLAEASLAVTFPTPGSGLHSVRLAVQDLAIGTPVGPAVAGERTQELVCLGHTVDHCELRITDNRGEVLADGTLGHVQIRGSNVTAGYYGYPAGETLADGWLDTGDLGLMSERGLLITGRARDVIFVTGQNWYPQDLEQILVRAGVGESGRVAISAVRSDDNADDRLLVFIQYRGELDRFVPRVADVQRVLAAETGLSVQAVIPLHRLPRTTSGKLQRYRLAGGYGQGEYAAVLRDLEALREGSEQAVSAGPVEQQLLELCRRRFPGHAIGVDQNLFELGADSLLLVSLHEDISARFPGKVEITDLFDYPTISSLSAYIERSAT